MDIRNVILAAKENQQGITRKKWMPGGITLIPTNTTACMVIIDNDNREKLLGQRWNPTADDLSATDWEVTG